MKKSGSFIKIRKVGSSAKKTPPAFDIVANSVDPDLAEKAKEQTAVQVLSKLKAVHGENVNQQDIKNMITSKINKDGKMVHVVKIRKKKQQPTGNERDIGI